MSSVEPFRRLVKLVARAFYDDDVTDEKDKDKDKEKEKEKEKEKDKGGSRKAERICGGETKGLTIVVLDALTRRQWMREEELARQLHLHPKQLRRTLKMLEEEMMIVREHRKENTRAAKKQKQEGDEGKEGEGEGEASKWEGKPGQKPKQHSHSYCCLHYPQIYDVVRYRIHRAKKAIKDELDSRKEVMYLLCPNPHCKARYSTLDTDRLIDPKKKEALQDMLARFERQLKPLMEQIVKVKDLTPPYFGSLSEWEAKASPAQRAAAVGGEIPKALPRLAGPGGGGGAGSTPLPFMGETRASPAQRAAAVGGEIPKALPRLAGPGGGGGAGSTPLPFMGETQVEVSIGGEDVAAGAGAAAGGGGGGGGEGALTKPAEMKVIPKWAIREGMVLTAAQRGEVEEEKAGGEGEGGEGGAGEGDGGAGEGAAGGMSAEEEAEQQRLQVSFGILQGLLRSITATAANRCIRADLFPNFYLPLPPVPPPSYQQEYYKAYYAALLQQQPTGVSVLICSPTFTCPSPLFPHPRINRNATRLTMQHCCNSSQQVYPC
ncbi:unnamed protein product [Closterium sp. Yama58-4]|nr:unnamed protein product [Closterium sp. Yama58-4]